MQETRHSKILRGIDYKTKLGLEFGPLHSPIVSKTDGKVDYVDFATQAYLVDKYKNDPNVDTKLIENVDIVLGESKGSLVDIVGREAYDYIVASHVLEHVPNLLGWLMDAEAILVKSGKIGLALPDRRFTFDHFRSPTELSSILAAHYRKSVLPGPEQIFDFLLYHSPVDAAQAWEYFLKDKEMPKSFSHNVQSAAPIVMDSLENGTYHDVHCWVFSDLEFCKLMLQLAQEDLVAFSCTSFYPTEKNSFEFYLTLQKSNRDDAIFSWERTIEFVQVSHNAIYRLSEPSNLNLRDESSSAKEKGKPYVRRLFSIFLKS